MTRVVITGYGVVTPLGHGKTELWRALAQGASGAVRITKFDPSRYACQIAAEIQDFDPLDFGMTRKEIKRFDPFTQFAMAAAHLAIEDAQLPLQERNPHIGVILGTGVGGLTTIEHEKDLFYQREGKGKNAAAFISPLFVPVIMPNAAAGNISLKYKLNNTSMSTATACATGLHAIISAAKDIVLGDASVVIAGGAEAGITPLGIGAFGNMGALCKDSNDDPTKGSRPFDKTRCGFVMGEGAGIIVLESLEHAQQRGARICAELVGYGLTSDAHHITSPAPEGFEIARAMELALQRAGVRPEEVDYINAHGTSTPDNDVTETRAIKRVFKDSAHKLKISSTKSMMGHAIGAAGALETSICLLAMEKGMVPPTINYEHPDPECDLHYVPNKAEACDVKIAMNNSFGFGGHNAVLLLKKFDG